MDNNELHDVITKGEKLRVLYEIQVQILGLNNDHNMNDFIKSMSDAMTAYYEATKEIAGKLRDTMKNDTDE